MTRSASFPRADAKVQSFASAFRGSPIQPNVVVLHTTEGSSWPSYSGGGSAPHLTAMPDWENKRLIWRQHFPLTMSARALRNDAGGVQTNTVNCVQVELIGTCDPKREGTKGWMFWPNAPAWAKDEVADFLAFMHREWALKLQGVPEAKWLPYPKSYGSASGQRLTPAAWSKFYGVCGHQHVPENDHGDPGDIDITGILDLAKSKVAPPKKTHRADRVWEIADEAMKGRMSKNKQKQWRAIKDMAAALSEEH